MIVRLKQRLSILLATILLFASLGGAASANEQQIDEISYEQNPVIVRWTNTTSVNTSLSFDGSRGTCGARVVGVTGTTNIMATVVLSQKNANGTYTAIKTWSGLSASGERLTFDSTYYVTTGYTYRLTINATVYLNGVGESVSKYCEAYAE